MDNLQTSAIQLDTIHLAIVCPMANESHSAVEFVSQVLAQCGRLAKVEFYAVLDNVSTDDTLDKLRTYAAAEERLKVVWAPENRCVVDAYQRGYREAIGSGADWVLEIDAGFSHRPADIPAFLDAMSKGYDCVFATRFALGGRIEGSSSRRKFVSKGGTVLTNFVLRTGLTDMTSGFQLFRRPILEKILAKGIFSRGPFFQTEMKAYCIGTRFTEVPIVYSMASHSLGAGSIKESLQQLRRLYALKRSGNLAL
jgi:dolichol-phosphate mannosyltransferase